MRMFEGLLDFCSNFNIDWIQWEDGLWYSCVEVIYQMEKTTDPVQRSWFASIVDPRIARNLGRNRTERKVTLRDGWDAGLKYDIMRKVVRVKFEQHPELRRRLLDTGDQYLVETNMHHDNDFGDCMCGRPACQAPGKNMLGIILTEEREYWRKQK